MTGDRDLSGGAPDDGVATDWPRWLDVLERAGIPASSNLRAPAEPGAVADAEAVFGREFPPALRALYALADGQLADHPRAPGPHPEVGTSLFPRPTASCRWPRRRGSTAAGSTSSPTWGTTT
nr:hypothetical protein [Pseudonocardia sp. AL041005-10]